MVLNAFKNVIFQSAPIEGTGHSSDLDLHLKVITP